MEGFRREYRKRFASLRAALDIVRKENAAGAGGGGGGDAAKDKREVERLQAELAAERRGAAEKDAALRKYEGFYRKVKARNEEKKRAEQQKQGQRA